MSVEDNVAKIEHLFSAFGRGDVETILGALAEDVDWQGPVSDHADVLPWAGMRRGREEVAEYFRAFAGASKWHPMEDVVFTAAGDRVLVEGRNRNESRATGRPYQHQWVMVFTFGDDGRIARFRHYYDPADITHAMG